MIRASRKIGTVDLVQVPADGREVDNLGITCTEGTKEKIIE